jgi:hypothetical protein
MKNLSLGRIALLLIFFIFRKTHTHAQQPEVIYIPFKCSAVAQDFGPITPLLLLVYLLIVCTIQL